MTKHMIGVFTLGALAVFVMTALAQPPEGRDKGPGKKGPPPYEKKGPPPPFEPGKILPPHVRDTLELSEDQEKQIGDLEKEVRTKLLRILTDEQKDRLQEMRDKGPKGPPPEKGKSKKKDKDNPRDRPEYQQTSFEAARSRLTAWLSGEDCPNAQR
jgi:hypothetical protein